MDKILGLACLVTLLAVIAGCWNIDKAGLFSDSLLFAVCESFVLLGLVLEFRDSS